MRGGGRRQHSGDDSVAEPADARLFSKRTTLEEGCELGWLKLNNSRKKKKRNQTTKKNTKQKNKFSQEEVKA